METIIAAVLSGGTVAGVITAWFNYKGKQNDSRQEGYQSVIQFLKEDNSRLRDDNTELRLDVSVLQEKVDVLEKIINKYEVKISLLESTHNYSPFPTWLKDMQGNMLSLNDAYESIFLRPNGLKKEDYIGKNDIAVWGEDIGLKYIENDLKALNSKQKVWIGKEPILIKGNVIDSEWQIVKYIRYAAGVKIGFAGKAIPSDLDLLNHTH